MKKKTPVYRILILTLLIVLSVFSVSVTEAAPSSANMKIVRAPKVKLKNKKNEKVTIMIYMNGSNLESDDQAATQDLKEMIKAGSSDQVNVVVQTMGTKKWSKSLGIASNRSQRYEFSSDGLTLVKDDLGQLDCTSGKTLQDFISWTAKKYPANRNILLFWDHGAGPVYGFGYDEFQDYEASLTIDEIQTALRNAGVYFDYIGMDCCIMSNLEVCCALYDFCDYVILSEDFESGIGWYYTNWLKALYKNPAMDTPSLAKIIIDDMVRKNEEDTSNGGEAILSLIDEGKMKLLMTAWKDFAYKNEKTLIGKNYSQKRTRKGTVRVHPKLELSSFFNWWSEDDVTMSDYFITDIMAVAQNINSEESDALSSALNNAIVYSNSTDGNSSLTGLAITLPYGDSDFYKELRSIFTNCGLDSEYVKWLNKFVSASGSTKPYDYDEWEEAWDGWDDYEDDYDWGLWDFLFGDDSEEYWEDEDNWGWAEDDEDSLFLDILDILFGDDENYDDYDDEEGFWEWLFSDDDESYDYEDYADDEEGFFEWLFSDDDESYDYEDYDDDEEGFFEWLFSDDY